MSSAFSRRSFLHLSAAATAAAAFRVVTEPMLAHAAAHPVSAAGAIRINANENPLGPCAAARDAISAVIPQGGRYQFDQTETLAATFARMEGLKPEYVKAYAGSGGPLHFSILAYTSPSRSYVTADPSYEAGMYTAKVSGARLVKVPLNKSHAHDVKAMLAAAPDAGIFYICTPNNPTGTLTSHSDIEYLLENKPKGSLLLIDEAYLHFSDAPSALDLVKADKDVILLRTFSKIYGMAGLRCGFVIARPDLLAKIDDIGGGNPMPITAVAAALASLQDQQLVPERRRLNAAIRTETFDWLDRNNYTYIPSESNCFLLDTKRPAQEIIDAMARQNVLIGRIWPIMPTYTRITVGTRPEMDEFRTAFKKAMSGAVSASFAPLPKRLRHSLDGRIVST